MKMFMVLIIILKEFYKVTVEIHVRFLVPISILKQLIHNLPKAGNDIVNIEVITYQKIKRRHYDLTSLHKVPKY